MILTKRWNVSNNKRDNREAIAEAAILLKKGALIAFPTETVYGLGADATNERAVNNIFKAKGRPQDNPLIAHVATKQQLLPLVTYIPSFAEKLIDAFSPGPITYILPSSGVCAHNVTANLPTIAVRIPDHNVARELLLQCDVPVAAPSANTSGRPSPTSATHVWNDLYGKIDGILDGGPTGIGMESTVVDCTKDIPIILRPGGITRNQIEQVVGTVQIDPGLLNKDDKPISPGMKYRHYSPDVPLWIVYGTPNTLQNIIDEQRLKQRRVGVLASNKTAELVDAKQVQPLGRSLTEIAKNLYDGLRSFNSKEVDLIVCEAFPNEGIGEAIMNRLQKAASKVIDKKFN